jgi:CRP-like cAMP-binding protein
MIINEKILKAHGAQLLSLEKEQYLLTSETYPEKYYQVTSGSLKITSDKIGSNEFIHQICGKGDPVGETFLSSEGLYKINAIALSPVTAYSLDRSEFHDILRESPETITRLYHYSCQQINQQQNLISKIAFSDPRTIILEVIAYLKNKTERPGRFQYEVPYTRQQIAAMTGMRIETVVRTVKLMEKDNIVKIVNGKVFY